MRAHYHMLGNRKFKRAVSNRFKRKDQKRMKCRLQERDNRFNIPKHQNLSVADRSIVSCNKANTWNEMHF